VAVVSIGVSEMRLFMQWTGATLSEIKTFTSEKTLMNAVALVLHALFVLECLYLRVRANA